MRIRLVLLLLLSTTCPPLQCQQASETQKLNAPAFLLRVNPKWTAQVNKVLSQLAQQLRVMVPAGKTPEDHLTSFCGGYLPAFQKLETLDSREQVLVTPCARVRRNVQIEVTAGDTLEGLAVLNGLPRTAVGSLKVIPSGDIKARSISPQELQIGDKVVFQEIPLWSPVVVNPDVAPDRAALVSALANSLGCGEKDPEECLEERDVSVLNRGKQRKEEVPEVLTFPFAERENWLSIFVSGISADAQVMARQIGVPDPAMVEVPSRLAMNVASGPLPAVQPGLIPVAPDQWPYDVGLLTAILKKAMDSGQIRLPTTIGVADGGLGNASGSPLPDTVFDIGDEKKSDEQNLEPDGDDNDGNAYIDDFFGAGVLRLQEGEFLGAELLGTGDLGLCKTDQPLFSTWQPKHLGEASHGVIVSSVATALGLRQVDPRIAGALPKLVFFRMVDNACSEDADFSPPNAEAELVQAFTYLSTRAQIVNISVILDVDEAGNKRFKREMRDIVPYQDVLLVVPAGNDIPGNLDRAGNCPACLGNDSADRGDTAARRTLVVGAATRELRRSFSNYGPRTVGIFAPGEPAGALNLAAEKVPSSASDATTSYAAPLAALAAAIVRSFGGPYISPMDIRDRLTATTWPLADPESDPEETHVGVLDLVKVAAVRMHGVEVEEPGPDGQPVRSTYVGKLVTPLKDLGLCAGRAFELARVHAVRLGQLDENGERRLLIYYRKQIDPTTNRRKIESISCRPESMNTLLKIEALTRDGGTETKTFPLSQVTQIQLPWVLGL